MVDPYMYVDIFRVMVVSRHVWKFLRFDYRYTIIYTIYAHATM